MNFCWSFFKWGLLVALIAAIAAVPYFHDRLDHEIRSQAEALLAEQYEGLDVSIRVAHFIENEGIELRDVMIVETGAAGPQAELLCLPEVFLHSVGSLQDILSDAPKIHQVVVRRPVLRMTRRHDGCWSCSRLLPLPKFGDGNSPMPPIRIEDATIEIFDPTKNPSSMTALRSVNLKIFESDTGETDETNGTNIKQIEGSLEGDYVSRVELTGQFDTETGAWSIGGVVDELEITSESLHAMPHEWLASCDLPDVLRAQATFRWALSGTTEDDESPPCSFSATGMVSQGRLEDARLPGALTEVETTFTVDNHGLTLRNLKAHQGQMALVIDTLRSWGHGADARKTVSGEVRRLELDRGLLAALPDGSWETWSKYLPSGQINAKFEVEFDGERWHAREAAIECLDVSFLYYKFPYRLHRARGTMRQGDKMVALKLENDVLRIGLEAYSGTQKVTISGTVFQPIDAPCGNVVVRAAKLDLHDELFSAMKEEPQKVVRSLNPKGQVGVYLRIWNDVPGTPPHKHMIVNVHGGTIRYERFPYPLAVHRGQIEMVDDQFEFRDFVASNDTGEVNCHGWFRPGTQGKELLLTFGGTNIALEEELRDALGRPNMRQLWTDLRLRGMVDLETLTVSYLVDTRKLDVSFRAVPHLDSTSIEAVHLPYRLDNVQGVLAYQDGQVTIEEFRAQHDDTQFAAKVKCRFFPDGSWNLAFDDLSVDRLRLDNELARALPARIRLAVSRLNADSPINLQGRVAVARHAGQMERLTSNWEMGVVFHRASLDCGVAIRDMSGGVQLSGTFNGQELLCRGELDIDSLTYRDIQITNVQGPILINDRHAFLGTAVEPSPGKPRESLHGVVFGGSVYGDGWTALGENPDFHLAGRLFQADLSHAARELVSGRQSLRGKLFANAEIWGRGSSMNSLEGRGNIRLREADIYELPAMVSLLRILTTPRPEQGAFSDGDIDFVIKGSHIYLPKINFKGDAFSLKGEGEMDFNHNVNLTFSTQLGRGELNLPLLRDVLSGVGEQIVVIHVEGHASNPRIVRQALPAVNRVFEQLQEDLNIPVDSPGLFPQAGGNGSFGRSATR